MRLIDADAYMEKVKHEAKAMPQKQGETFVILSEWIIEKTPTVEPKQGEWIRSHIGTIAEGIFCSNCDQRSYDKTNYCPNCGAKMI